MKHLVKREETHVREVTYEVEADSPEEARQIVDNQECWIMVEDVCAEVVDWEMANEVTVKTMKFETHNDNPAVEEEACNGTCLQGEITADYNELVMAFGEPTAGDEYKVDAEWCIKFANGTIATVYNWKNGINYCGPSEGTPTEQITHWHIGGFNPDAVDLVRGEVFAKQRGGVTSG